MRIVFFGSGSFAVPSLKALADSVTLVVSQPDRPAGRGMRPRPSPVKAAAVASGLEVGTPERCGDLEFLARVASENADALVVAAYGQILPESLLRAARMGGINLHASALPKYRGAAPIQRAILAGETETGVALMQMDKGMDTGDVIALEATDIGPDETASELQERLAAIAARLAKEWLPRICSGDYPRKPQDHGIATLAPRVSKSEAELSFDRAAQSEYDRFRAFTDSPGAFLRTSRGNLGVLAARCSTVSGAPGEVLAVSPELCVAFSGGSLRLLTVRPPGKNAMSGRDLANGWRLRPGSELGNE